MGKIIGGEMRDLIIKVMEEKHISQKSLCEILEVSPATLKRLKGTLNHGKVSKKMRVSIKNKLENLLKQKVTNKKGKVERKPKYTESNGIYTVYYGKGQKVSITKEKLRKMKRYYCTGKFNINDTVLEFGLVRREFIAIKTAFNIVKTDIPCLDEDFDNIDVELLVEQERIEKKRFFNKRLNERTNEDREKRIKKYDTENYFLKKILDEFKKITPMKIPEYTENIVVNKGIGGIIQLSDFHFGSDIKVVGNNYNKEIAKQRIYDLFNKAKYIFKKQGVSQVYILFTGDMSNVLLHRDKQLAQMGSRAKDMVELSYILGSNINKLSSYFKIEVAGILGNESRLSDEFSGIDEWASDSYDYILFQMLKHNLHLNKRVIFINECDKLNTIVRCGLANISLLHGDNLKGNLDQAINNIKLKWLNSGRPVDYTLFGHIHSTLITNSYARSASLVGADSYSEHKLNIAESYASQNIGLIFNRRVVMLPLTLK